MLNIRDYLFFISIALEVSEESEEETKYLTMPEILKDKFLPLYFIPLCTKEYNEDEWYLNMYLLKKLIYNVRKRHYTL